MRDLPLEGPKVLGEAPGPGVPSDAQGGVPGKERVPNSRVPTRDENTKQLPDRKVQALYIRNEYYMAIGIRYKTAV